MKARFFISSLLFALLLSSCDKYILNIEIDNNGFEKSFDFECGRMDVRGKVYADIQLVIAFQLTLDSSILIVPEKLEIIHNNVPFEAGIFYEERWRNYPITEQRIIDNNGVLTISVNSNQHTRFRAGDTVTINIDNFIICKDNPLGIGKVNLIFVERKR